MEGKAAQQARLSFRAQLVLFGLLLVMIVALPSLIIEIQRPWDELNQLISRGKIITAEVKADFNLWDLQRMNAFALEIQSKADPDNEDYLIWAFNLMIQDQELPTYDEIVKTVLENNEQIQTISETNLGKALAFWQEQFAKQPELLPLFKKYKEKLIQAKSSSEIAGFSFDDTYVMVDDGQKLVFLLDGAQWWESSYPGLEYDIIKNDCPYFRDYLKKGPGFDTDPIHYHYGLLPKFNTDKWGTWFSVWLAEKNNDTWNNYAVDIPAGHVKKMMWTIAGFIITTVLAITLIIVLITSKLSSLISKPIGNLIIGTEAIINGDYDHEVPHSGSREFEELTGFHNKMRVQLKERDNMERTLEKVLSPELAKQAKKHGFILSGQKALITNLFTDFVGFSSITKNMESEAVVAMLNDYYSQLIPILKKHGGFPDKFIGDAIVAIFGAPIQLPNHAESAITCAIEMQFLMRQINAQRRKEGKPVFEMRIGLNSGEVIVGAIGSDLKLEYTAIGEPTNLAQRMEAGCQPGHILIAENTFNQVQGIFFDEVDFGQSPQEITVKGYNQPVKTYNIFIDNSVIEKNIGMAGTPEFYKYSTADHHIKFAEKLTQEERKKFSKIVKITPS